MIQLNFAKYANMSLAERVERFKEDAINEARLRFRDGDFSNPYSLSGEDERDPLRKGMVVFYDEEIRVLLTERLCPCCGQYTMGDLDY